MNSNAVANQAETDTILIQQGNPAVHGGHDSMEALLLHESMKQGMGPKRPNAIPCLGARGRDWSVCGRSRAMGVTAR